MAQQHTTPERSLAAAYAHQERAVGVGQESRLKKDPCYQLYEESLKCLDEHDYDRGLCADAFAEFKACRSRLRNTRAGAEEGASTLESMLKAQEKDPVLGPLMQGYRWVRDTVSSPPQPPEPEPDPEWKVAKRQQEQQRQLEQQMQEMQAVLEQQREEQQRQKRGWRRWFGRK